MRKAVYLLCITQVMEDPKVHFPIYLCNLSGFRIFRHVVDFYMTYRYERRDSMLSVLIGILAG
jgi:hypothetical protein